VAVYFVTGGLVAVAVVVVVDLAFGGGFRATPEWSLVAILFRQVSDKLVELIRTVDGLSVGEAIASVYATLPEVCKDLWATCGTAAVELERLQLFVTS
jgi:hypothetical protein